MSACTEASPVLIPRAIVRPIPMPGFKVSVFDDTTGAPIPQVLASDGGGLINGQIFSAPNMTWAIAALVIGLPLGVAGVRLWRVTTALGGGLLLAFAMWVALINTISETGFASSQSMSDMILILITGAAFLVGVIGGAFRLVVLPAMAAICALGGASVATRGVILRPGLLVPPGLNQQLAFANIVIIATGALMGGLSVIFKRRESMIFSTASIGSFLIALTVDLFLNGQNGMSRGLRFLLDMNDNHLADLVGGGYSPPISSQIIVASSIGLVPILSLFQHFAFPGSFQRPRPRDRTQLSSGEQTTLEITQLLTYEFGLPMANLILERRLMSFGRLLWTEDTTPSKPSSILIPPRTAPGPAWRNSVLSLFRVPGRFSKAGSGSASFDSRGADLLSTKIANERRGSSAYNYGQGVYALPSELLRQESQARKPLPPTQPKTYTPQLNVRPPPLSVVREQPNQFAGVGLRGYRDRLAAVGNTSQTTVRDRGFNPSTARNIPAQGVANAVLRSPRAPRGFDSPSTIDVRHRGIPQAVTGPNLPSRQGQQVSTQTAPADRTRGAVPQNQPPTSAMLAPTADDIAPASTPRMAIGLGMLRMSVDSIIDAYGETKDSGYRYGGSRTGNGGRI